jgi:hypothetical protein
MRANPNDRLDRQYEDLTPKQQAIIDAHAENPDATNRKKAKLAGEKLGEGSVNESYCSQSLNNDYPEVAQYRAEIVQNEREEGQMQTVGDPFEAIPQQDSGYQSIQDRQVKRTQGQEQQADGTTGQIQDPTDSPLTPQQVAVSVQDDGVVVKFDRTYFRNLLETQELPPHMHKQLVAEIWRQM